MLSRQGAKAQSPQSAPALSSESRPDRARSLAFALTFTPTSVTAARSNGKLQTMKGKYVTLWGKQPGGSWKAVVDAPTTTP